MVLLLLLLLLLVVVVVVVVLTFPLSLPAVSPLLALVCNALAVSAGCGSDDDEATAIHASVRETA